MSDRASATLALFGKTFNPDGTLRAVSPSQIETFLQCPLKWFFDKKEKLQRKPPSKGQILGDKCHKEIERFLIEGADVRGPLPLVGAAMLEPYVRFSPFNGGPGEVEMPLLAPRLQTPGGVLITGFEDYHVPDPAGLWPTIIDHKFKKSLAKYAPTEDELLEDTQCIVYGAHALARYPDAVGYEFRHHNHQTEGEGGRFAKPVVVRVPRADGWARWLELCKVIDGPMTLTARAAVVGGGKTPDVPFEIGACGNFGGCDFARVCRHSPQNRFVAGLRNTSNPITETVTFKPTTKENQMGLISQLAASANAVPLATTTKPETPALVRAKDCKQGEMYVTFQGRAKFQGLLGTRAFFQAGDGGDIILKPDDPVEPVFEAAQKEIHEAGIAGIVAVAGTLGPAHAAEVKASLEAPALSAAKQEKARKMGIVDMSTPEATAIAPVTAPPQTPKTQEAPPVMAATSTEVAVTVAQAVETTVAKRGRPTKAESEAKRAAAQTVSTTVLGGTVVVPVDMSNLKVETGRAQAAESQAPVSDEKMLFLIVDAACSQARDLTGFVSEVCKRVADQYGAPDVRLGHKNSDLGFTGWKGCLAIEALKNPPTGLCTISSGELADPIIEALAPTAKVLVRGVR